MRTGASISAAVHLALIALVIFGGPIFEHKKQTRLQIADVTLISAAELDAAASRAPRPPNTDTAKLTEPGVSEAPAVVPVPENTPVLETAPAQETPSPEPAPDLTALARPPDVASVPVTTIVEAAPQPTATDVPAAPASPTRQPAAKPARPDALAIAQPPLPSNAPRIDSTASPKPPTDAERADTAQPEIAPAETAVVLREERPPLAPPEATTEISLEPVENPVSSAAPPRAARPRSRPASVVEKARKAHEPRTEVASNAPAKPDAPPETPDKPAVQPTGQTPDAPRVASIAAGPPLTGGEIDGLRLSIKKCWSVPAGLRNAEELEVVVGVTLSQDGKVVGGAVRWLEPADHSDPRFSSAFRAARRAILRCQPYAMPRDKYAQWRELEVVFNPKGMKGLW